MNHFIIAETYERGVSLSFRTPLGNKRKQGHRYSWVWVVRVQVDFADLFPHISVGIRDHDVLQVVEQVDILHA